MAKKRRGRPSRGFAHERVERLPVDGQDGKSDRALERAGRAACLRDPKVVVLPADRAHSNPSNPFEHAAPAARWAERVRILGKRIARSWEGALSLQEGEKEVFEMDDERLITRREAWERMGVSERQFHRWVKQAKVPRYRIGGAVRYKWSDIERALGCGDAQGSGDGSCPAL